MENSFLDREFEFINVNLKACSSDNKGYLLNVFSVRFNNNTIRKSIHSLKLYKISNMIIFIKCY